MRVYLPSATWALLLFASTVAQPIVAQNKIADYSYGGSGMDSSVGALQTADGGYLLGASTMSNVSGEVTQPARGPVSNLNIDFWIVKTDAQGTKLWDKRYGGTHDDRLEKIVSAADGGYLLCGWSTSGAGFDKTEATRGLTDYWVVKIDAEGNKQWDKRFGSRDHDYLASATSSPDGGFLLTGWSGSNTSLPSSGDRTDAVNGYSDLWLVKIDAAGNKQWDKTYGGLDGEYLYETVSVAGGYVLGALSFGAPSGDVTGPGRGGTDYWLIKVDEQGNKVWDKLCGGPGSDVLRTLLATPDGGVLAGGLSTSPIGGDKSSYVSGKDCWLIKLDAQGNKQWDAVYGTAFGTSLSEIPTTLQNNPNGGYLLGGSIGKISPVPDPSDVPSNYWIMAIGTNGQQAWEQSFGGIVEEQISSILPKANGNLLVVGSSNSPVGQDKTSANRGGYDIWLVELTNTVLSSTSQQSLAATTSVFPNPASEGYVNLQVEGLSETSFVKGELVDNLGRVVQQFELRPVGGSIRSRLEFGSFPRASYTLHLHTNKGIIAKPIFVK